MAATAGNRSTPPVALLSPTTIRATVVDTAFEVVEDDDVAFSLALCREVQRLYASYQSGELESTDEVGAGLDLARQMVLALQGSIDSGMPAMRLQVAAAQTAEMTAVLVGDRRRSPAAARALIEARVSQPASPGPAEQPAVTARSKVRAGLRVAAGLVACVVLGVLITVPVAVMALFPDHLTLIGSAYAAVAVLFAAVRSRARPRSTAPLA